ELFIVGDRGAERSTWRAKLRRLGPCFTLLALTAAGGLAARAAVTGSLIGGRAGVGVDVATRVWTMLGGVPEWVRLFVWPGHLSAEYGPQQISIRSGPSAPSLLGMLLLIVAVALFGLLLRRARSQGFAGILPLPFALAWLGITLLPATNLVTGLVLEERTLFL